MKRSYKFHTDRFVMIFSVIIILVGVLGVWVLYELYTGGFVSAWFSSVIIAIALLMLLSVPRRIVLLDNTLEVQCISDITEIPLDEIEHIHTIPRSKMRWMLPIIGVMGFFGYYGRFLDVRRWRTVHLYLSEWNNFVEIVTIHGSHYYLSCREAEELITTVKELQTRQPSRQ